MFYLFLLTTVFFSFIFFRNYYPYFKGANDMFSIYGFLIIYAVTTALIYILVFTPYYLFFV